jgi:TetR/AcrR family transcriptional repressor of mexJK operon
VAATLSTARRGRPRDPQRLARVLDAARRNFHAEGFERTSLDVVAAESGVSKMTIYSYFPSKEALFAAVIASRTDNTFRLSGCDPSRPDQALKKVATAFLRLMRADEVVGQFRALYATAPRQPDVCAAFYREGPGRLVAELASYLRSAHASGSLRIRDADAAADQFLAMFLGSGHMTMLLGLEKPAAQSDARLVSENVRALLCAHGATAPLTASGAAVARR